jgi:hypothetical protein
VPMLLSMNGQQYADGGVMFSFQGAISLSFVSPLSVSAEGGTPVTVHGIGFSPVSESLGLLLCRLAHATTPASLLSTSSLVCTTPRSTPGFHAIEVTNNARDYVGRSSDFSSGSVAIDFIAIRIIDAHPFAGPVDGKTIVTLVGYGFQIGGLTCGFGDEAHVQAERLSAYRVSCEAPPSRVLGWVRLELKSFGRLAESTSAFYYQASISSVASFIDDEVGGDGDGESGAENALVSVGAVTIGPALGPIWGGTIGTLS